MLTCLQPTVHVVCRPRCCQGPHPHAVCPRTASVLTCTTDCTYAGPDATAKAPVRVPVAPMGPKPPSRALNGSLSSNGRIVGAAGAVRGGTAAAVAVRSGITAGAAAAVGAVVTAGAANPAHPSRGIGHSVSSGIHSNGATGPAGRGSVPVSRPGGGGGSTGLVASTMRRAALLGTAPATRATPSVAPSAAGSGMAAVGRLRSSATISGAGPSSLTMSSSGRFSGVVPA